MNFHQWELATKNALPVFNEESQGQYDIKHEVLPKSGLFQKLRSVFRAIIQPFTSPRALRDLQHISATSQDEIRYLKREIENLRQSLEDYRHKEPEIVEQCTARVAELLEPRIQCAVGEAKAFAVQTWEQDQRLTARVAEVIEPRVQLACREAMAFAASRVDEYCKPLEVGFRALGRRVSASSKAEFSKSEPHEPSPTKMIKTAHYAIGTASAETQDCHHLDLSDVSGFSHLPIPPEGASKLVVSHSVEHVTPALLSSTILPHWHSLIVPGGELILVTLDGPAWSADLARMGKDFEQFRQHLSRGQGLTWLYSAEELDLALREAGFLPEPPASIAPCVLKIRARAA